MLWTKDKLEVLLAVLKAELDGGYLIDGSVAHNRWPSVNKAVKSNALCKDFTNQQIHEKVKEMLRMWRAYNQACNKSGAGVDPNTGDILVGYEVKNGKKVPQVLKRHWWFDNLNIIFADSKYATGDYAAIEVNENVYQAPSVPLTLHRPPRDEENTNQSKKRRSSSSAVSSIEEDDEMPETRMLKQFFSKFEERYLSESNTANDQFVEELTKFFEKHLGEFSVDVRVAAQMGMLKEPNYMKMFLRSSDEERKSMVRMLSKSIVSS